MHFKRLICKWGCCYGRTDLKDPAQIRHQRHLFVKLRRLREIGVPAEVAQAKDIRAA